MFSNAKSHLDQRSEHMDEPSVTLTVEDIMHACVTLPPPPEKEEEGGGNGGNGDATMARADATVAQADAANMRERAARAEVWSIP